MRFVLCVAVSTVTSYLILEPTTASIKTSGITQRISCERHL